MRNIIVILLFLCTLFISACSDSSNKSNDKAEIMLDGESITEQTESYEQTNRLPAMHAEQKENRKISMTAHIEIVIENMTDTVKQVTDLVQNEDGYVVSSDIHHNEKDNKTGRITVKVPQEKFYSFLETLDKWSVEVVNETIQAEDVTEEYVDLTARLKAKQAVMKRLETFLNEAKTTKDLLEVTVQMGEVQTEIEQIEGRLKFIKNQTDYATVTISMTEKEGFVSTEQNTWIKAKQLFVATINAIISFLSGTIVIVVGLSPIIIPVILIGSGIFIYRKRKKRSE